MDDVKKKVEGPLEVQAYGSSILTPNHWKATQKSCLGDTARRTQGVIVENGFHYFKDGHFWIEVPGLLEREEEDFDDFLEFNLRKKPSRVSFDTGPIRVYSTHSISEYNRQNEEMDPVAASAEYELEKLIEKMEIFPVEVMKGPEGLGLGILGMGVGAGVRLEKLGIFVKSITKNGAVAREGQIKVNDQILEVNGSSLVGVSQTYAGSILHNTFGIVRFRIGRERDPKNSEVVQLIKQSIEADTIRKLDLSIERSLNFMNQSTLNKRKDKNKNFDNDVLETSEDILITTSSKTSYYSENESCNSVVESYESLDNRIKSPIISSSKFGYYTINTVDDNELKVQLQERQPRLDNSELLSSEGSSKDFGPIDSGNTALQFTKESFCGLSFVDSFNLLTLDQNFFVAGNTSLTLDI